MKVIHLVLKGVWFDMMVSGMKDVEYREIKPHWIRLLWSNRNTITHAKFSRGYTKKSITRKVRSIDIGPCPYAGWAGDYYRIHMEPYTDSQENTEVKR